MSTWEKHQAKLSSRARAAMTALKEVANETWPHAYNTMSDWVGNEDVIQFGQAFAAELGADAELSSIAHTLKYLVLDVLARTLVGARQHFEVISSTITKLSQGVQSLKLDQLIPLSPCNSLCYRKVATVLLQRR